MPTTTHADNHLDLRQSQLSATLYDRTATANYLEGRDYMGNLSQPNETEQHLISRSVIVLVGLTLLFALGIVALVLVKDAEWFSPIARVFELGDVYPTQGLIGPQKTIRDRERATRP